MGLLASECEEKLRILVIITTSRRLKGNLEFIAIQIIFYTSDASY